MKTDPFVAFPVCRPGMELKLQKSTVICTRPTVGKSPFYRRPTYKRPVTTERFRDRLTFNLSKLCNSKTQADTECHRPVSATVGIRCSDLGWHG